MLVRLAKFIGKHPDIERWLNEHSRFVRIVKHRFDKKTFFGLPLTALVVLSLASLWILASVIQDYIARDPLIATDVRIANLLFAFRSVFWTHSLNVLTSFASPITGATVIIFLVACLCARKQWISAATGFIGFFGAEIITTVLKFLFHRTRPDLILRAVYEDSYSLPSGHATTAAFVFGYIGYLLLLRFKSKKKRILILLCVIALVSVIDFSRIYLGVHYLSDVIAGNAIGFLVLFVAIGADQWLSTGKRKQLKSLPAIFVACSVIVFIASVMLVHFMDKSPWTVATVHERQSIETKNVMGLFTDGVLPNSTETLIGEPQEPISLIIIVPDPCLETDLAKAGWTFAVPAKLSSVYRLAKAAIFNDEYLSAPMTPSFYNALPHDFGFEKPTDIGSARQRHHARFWDTFYETPDGHVLVGTASLDTGIKWAVTHSIAPDIDTERDMIVSDLSGAGVIVSQEEIRHFVDPVLGQNFANDFFFTNGGAVLLRLVDCK